MPACPQGVINVVTGFGSDVWAHRSTEHPDVRAISLTGSTAVGRIVGTTAAKSFKHCSLELGGKNPMIVLDDANLDLAIEGGLWGGFGTTGQRCTATSRIIVQKGVYRRVRGPLRRPRQEAEGRQRPRRDRSTWARPSTKPSSRPISATSTSAKSEGAKLVCGGNRLDKGEYQYGYFMEPTVFIDVDPKMRIAQEEVFGPVVSIISCEDLEDAIEIANGIEYGLSSALYTKDVNRAFTAIRDLVRWHHLHQRAHHRRRSALCRSAARRPPATATAKAASAPSTSILSGSRCTSTIPTSCRKRRSIGWISRQSPGRWSSAESLTQSKVSSKRSHSLERRP